MPLAAFAFLAGNVLLHQLPELHGSPWPFIALIVSGLASGLVFLKKPLFLFMGLFAAGFAWTFLSATLQLAHTSDFNGGDFNLDLQVVSIPVNNNFYASFVAKVLTAPTSKFPQKIRLNLYDQSFVPVLGEQIQAQVRLKPRHGYRNPGGFDYEQFLFSQKIGASGYIRSWHSIRRPAGVENLRQIIYSRILEKTRRSGNSGPILALAMGERGYMTPRQWDLLAATGTGHLFAISGLHIALVFGLMFVVGQWVWKRYFLIRYAISTRTAAVVFALPWAFFYAWLAGFSIPTQRALIMLICVVIARLIMRRTSLLNILALALFVVLLKDPFSSLSASFWLSFAAVMAIVIYYEANKMKTGYWCWLGLYFYLPIAMFVAGLYFFGQGAIFSPFANLLAIPYASFLVLPLVLAAVLFSVINETICQWLIVGVDFLLDEFWKVAAWIESNDFSRWFYRPSSWTYLPALLGVIALPIVTGIRRKTAALILISTLTVHASPKLAKGEFEVTFLDVGQGLAVVISTHQHHLLFDTGPAYPSGFNLGNVVVVPYLLSKQISTLDAVVLSHSDMDHAGGMNFILKRIKVDKKFAGGDSLPNGFNACQKGIQWSWDGIHFEFLHPGISFSSSRNNTSCVLKVSNESRSVLLTADIEKQAEQNLITTIGLKLRSDILLVPHHGSLTSSSAAFLDAVRPSIAVVSSGFKNRFGFPKEKIVEAYLKRCIVLHNTAFSGAVQIVFTRSGKIELSHYRTIRRRYWNAVSKNLYALSKENCKRL